MTQEQLMDRYLRLKRKLSPSYDVWHSGRMDRLADALRSVEREIDARQPKAALADRAAVAVRH